MMGMMIVNDGDAVVMMMMLMLCTQCSGDDANVDGGDHVADDCEADDASAVVMTMTMLADLADIVLSARHIFNCLKKIDEICFTHIFGK